ncbi:MAG: hypothetical protein KAZ48_09585 [Candidatus Nanopelagicales bacterium]|nr:hypothetical protein [Candidatus Nanopelagicales bacterium]
MYERLWRVLPGPTWAKLFEVTVLLVAVVVLLFLIIFPWATAHLPIDQVTVTGQPPGSHTVSVTVAAAEGEAA